MNVYKSTGNDRFKKGTRKEKTNDEDENDKRARNAGVLPIASLFPITTD